VVDIVGVGPGSAGSDPGPVAFGRGGGEPTVADANIILGRIGSDVFRGGRLTLDPVAARAAMAQRIACPLGLGDRQWRGRSETPGHVRHPGADD